MDYFGVVREAWDLIRRERGLTGLAAFEMLQFILAWLLVLATSLPVFMIAVLAVPAQDRLAVSSLADSLTLWLANHYVSLMVVIVAVFIGYAAGAVLSVAAQGGIVLQTAEALRGAKASTAQGMGSGFRYWWRSAAILALPALPTLIYYLALAVVMQNSLVAPISAGQRPDFARLDVAVRALSSVSGVLGVLTIPLSVLAVIALRFALIDDCEWKDAFVEAWRFAKRHVAHVALLFLVIYLVMIVAALAGEFAVGMVAAVLFGITMWVGIGIGTGAGIAVGVASAVVVLVLFSALLAALGLLSSVAWTVMWAKLRWAPPVAEVAPAAIPAVPPVGPPMGPPMAPPTAPPIEPPTGPVVSAPIPGVPPAAAQPPAPPKGEEKP